ncbi:MAG: hypothetical protein AAB649_06545 [Patescibacteria group bacterium]
MSDFDHEPGPPDLGESEPNNWDDDDRDEDDERYEELTFGEMLADSDD